MKTVEDLMLGVRSVALFTLLTSALLTSAAARADNIVLNQWYEFGFGTTDGPPSAISSSAPFYTVPYNAPAPGGPIVIPIPTGDSWTITLATPGYLVVADVEESGDQMTMFNNGVQLGTTSNPCVGCEFSDGDLTYILSDSNFSNGEFDLPAGVDTITGTWLGFIGEGDGALVVSSASLIAPTPLPSTWTMMLIGLAGLGFAAYRGTKNRPVGLAAA
jgi:hypothetical protein